jgi:hypothetical protein
VGKPGGKRPCGRRRPKWKNNIEMVETTAQIFNQLLYIKKEETTPSKLQRTLIHPYLRS